MGGPGGPLPLHPGPALLLPDQNVSAVREAALVSGPAGRQCLGCLLLQQQTQTVPPSSDSPSAGTLHTGEKRI